MIIKFNVQDIQSAYSGKAGCACGCNGNYSYVKAHQAAASKNRGYDVTDDEINERQVARILNVIKRAAADAVPQDITVGSCYISLTTETRVYTVYPACWNKK